MTAEQIVTKFYLKAVDGLKDNWLTSRTTEWYDYIIALPLKERFTYIIMIMHDQVHNGGFDQYFINAYGRFVYETIPALKQIGAANRSILLSEALKVVNENNYAPEIFREKIVAKSLASLFNSNVSAKLNELDDQYYDLEGEDVFDLLYVFLTDDSLKQS